MRILFRVRRNPNFGLGIPPEADDLVHRCARMVTPNEQCPPQPQRRIDHSPRHLRPRTPRLRTHLARWGIVHSIILKTAPDPSPRRSGGLDILRAEVFPP